MSKYANAEMVFFGNGMLGKAELKCWSEIGLKHVFFEIKNSDEEKMICIGLNKITASRLVRELKLQISKIDESEVDNG